MIGLWNVCCFSINLLGFSLFPLIEVLKAVVSQLKFLNKFYFRLKFDFFNHKIHSSNFSFLKIKIYFGMNRDKRILLKIRFLFIGWYELLYRQYTLNYRNNLEIRQSGRISHESGRIAGFMRTWPDCRITGFEIRFR